MSILEQSPGLLDALHGEMTPKFLATRSPDGVPNVVPLISLRPAADQEDTLFFGNFLLRKSIDNLKRDARVGILVITPELRGWVMIADFVEFQRTGPYVDQQMGSSLLRYNAYTGIRNAGVIRVREMIGAFAVSRLQVVAEYLMARWTALVRRAPADSGIHVPRPVQREFARMVAVKVLAWVPEDGYPRVIPMLSLQPGGDCTLLGWTKSRGLPRPPDGVLAASNILTFEAISYQAKGLWMGKGNAGLLQVREVYAGGPPLPGGRVA